MSFHRLRAEGAFEVSAQRKNGQNQWVLVKAGRNGTLTLRDPLPGQAPIRNKDNITRNGNDIRVELNAGEFLEGTL